MKSSRARAALALVVVMLALCGCRSGPSGGWSSRARTMRLTSGPTEVVMSSSKIPGYWARETGSGQEFFLFTSTRSYEKGDLVTVEGPFGNASPTVLRDETGEYVRWYPVYVLVVWRIEKEVPAHEPRT